MYILDPMDFDSVHLKVSSLAASDMAKISHVTNTSKIQELAFNSHSEKNLGSS